MNITNNGKKIFNIGTLALLPGETAPLPKEYEDNPVVAFFIQRGTLSTDQPIKSPMSQAPTKDDAEALARAREEAEAAIKAKDEAEAALQASEGEKKALHDAIAAIKKMNRAELDAACADKGVEVKAGDTIPVLQAKLIANLLEG